MTTGERRRRVFVGGRCIRERERDVEAIADSYLAVETEEDRKRVYLVFSEFSVEQWMYTAATLQTQSNAG